MKKEDNDKLPYNHFAGQLVIPLMTRLYKAEYDTFALDQWHCMVVRISEDPVLVTLKGYLHNGPGTGLENHPMAQEAFRSMEAYFGIQTDNPHPDAGVAHLENTAKKLESKPHVISHQG